MWDGREQRRSPRIDVLLRIKGQVVDLDIPIIVRDLSRTGFAVVSEAPFTPGQRLEFRMVARDGTDIRVMAEAVHTHPLTDGRRGHLSGFKFVPLRLTGLLPESNIDRLVAAVNDGHIRFFDK